MHTNTNLTQSKYLEIVESVVGTKFQVSSLAFFRKNFCIAWENIKSFRFDTIPRHGQAMFMDNAFRQLTVSLLVFTNTFSWKGRKNSEIPEAKRFFELAKVSIFAFRFYAHVRFYRMPIPH